MRHTVVLSDLHLWEAIAPDGLWMRYRSPEHFPDAGLADLCDRLVARVEDGSLELVLNGDIFDFDVPRPDGRDDSARSEPEAVARIDRILDDHPVFIAALARLLARGHRVVFVTGNHDVQLTFPAVRERILARIEEATAAFATPRHPHHSGVISLAPARAVRVRVLFRAWFHRTVDGVHVEHGHQYDPFCAVRYPQSPFIPGTREVQPTLSSLSMRHLAGRMGYFNPNVDSTFLLSGPGYLAHWARHYLFSRRSLVVAWVLGSVRVAFGLLADGTREETERALGNLLRTARETGASLEPLSEHAALFARSELRRSARILCLDRLLGVALALAGALGVTVHPLAGALLVALALAVLVFGRRFLPDGDLGLIYARVQRAQHQIARLHGARAVVFGHTHIPVGDWQGDGFFGNSGTWAPMYHDIACTRPLQTTRPFIWLRANDEGTLDGGLYYYAHGVIEADPGGARERPSDADHDDRVDLAS